MSLLIQKFANKFCKPSVPDLRPGMIVKVHQKIKEGNKTRIQVFQGTVIAVNSGHNVDDTFTVRKISGGIGVEKVFPIHSPNIVKIDVQRAQKVRRAKLTFLRDRSGKALRLKEVPLKLNEKIFEGSGMAEEVITEEMKREMEEAAKAEEVAAAKEVAVKEVAVEQKTEEKKEEKPAEEKPNEEAKKEAA